MSISKCCFLILVYFLSRVAFAAPCETFQGHEMREKLCWSVKVKGWLPEKCADHKCDAGSFFLSPKKTITIPEPHLGQSRSSLICHELKLPVVILRDSLKNEQAFCLFKDKSMIDSNAIERHFR